MVLLTWLTNQILNLVLGKYAILIFRSEGQIFFTRKDVEKMSDQWGRKIWEAIRDSVITPDQNTADLVEAAYDRRDENGVEVPGIPGETPPPETSFDQKSYDSINYGSELNHLLGRVPGITSKVAAGYVKDLDEASNYPIVVSVSSNLYYGQSFVGLKQLRFRLTSDDDIATGIGAQEVRFEGLDGDFIPFTYDRETTGRAPQTIPQNIIRVYSAKVIRSGTSRHNIGTLQCWFNSGSDNQRLITIAPEDSYGSVAALTSPLNKYVFLKHITIRVNLGAYIPLPTDLNYYYDFRMKLQAQKIAVSVPGTWTQLLSFTAGHNSIQTFDINLMLTDLVDIRVQVDEFTGMAPTGGGTAIMISCELHYLEVDTGIVDVSKATIFEVF